MASLATLFYPHLYEQDSQPSELQQRRAGEAEGTAHIKAPGPIHKEQQDTWAPAGTRDQGLVCEEGAGVRTYLELGFEKDPSICVANGLSGVAGREAHREALVIQWEVMVGGKRVSPK